MSKRVILVGLLAGLLFTLLVGQGSASAALLASGTLAVVEVARLPAAQ